MTLHLLKLCVGPATIEDLRARIARGLDAARREGRPLSTVHVTRMLPKRAGEIVGRGSLYWVIKGSVACRQPVTAIEPFVDADGIPRCRLLLDPELRTVAPRPCRPFQGWRYLAASSAPADLAAGPAGSEAMPEAMRRELAALGLL